LKNIGIIMVYEYTFFTQRVGPNKSMKQFVIMT